MPIQYTSATMYGKILDRAVDTIEIDDHSITVDKLDAGVLAMIGGGAGGDVNIPDGADITQGAKADTAWDESAGSPSIVSILKKAVSRLTGIMNNTGNTGLSAASIDTNTGTTATRTTTIATNTTSMDTKLTTTNTNTGNAATSVASVDTKLTTTNTNTGTAATGIGAPADTAWASGSGSIIALLKNLAAGIASTVSGVGAQADAAWSSGNGTLVAIMKAIAGTNSTAATNSTTIAGSVASARMNTNIQRTGGTTSTTIASGATDSAAVDISTYIAGGFITPATMTGTSLTYKVSQTTSGHVPLYDQYGNLVTTPISTSQSRGYPFPAEAAGYASLVITSSGAEGATRTFNIYRKG